jgi:very-short-patch-repair endonuclease
MGWGRRNWADGTGRSPGLCWLGAMEQPVRTALCRLAEGQCGLFSAAQAAHLGVSRAQLTRAALHGHLRRSRMGVYAFNGPPGRRCEPLVAAALAAGPHAVISHTAAAVLHRLAGIRLAAMVPELTVAHPHHPKLAGVVVHRGAPLPAQDVAVKYGVLVTSPARTLLDLAGRYRPSALERLLDEGLIERRWGVVELRMCLERTAPNARGRSTMDHLLALRAERPAADSVLEALAFEALQPLAPFKTHFVLEIGPSVYVLDAAWPDRRVAAEIVGRAHRVASRSAFDRERRKLNALAAAGWRVAHQTSVMAAAEMVATVRKLL